MAARALWKGTLKLGDVRCAVGLYSAAPSSERIALHVVNRRTGNGVQRRYVDEETGEPVAREDEVKGYEIEPGRFVIVTAEEIAAAIPESDKTLAVTAFVGCGEVDKTYFDKPYYLLPTDEAAAAGYKAVAAAMEDEGVAALAQTVLFRRLRNVLIRATEGGLLAQTLRFDHEVRNAADIFEDLKTLEIKGEMLDLARHIVETKTRDFDPRSIDDRYEDALAALVKAKASGKAPPKRRAPETSNVVDLLDALRQSAGRKAGVSRKAPGERPAAAKRPAAKRAKPAPTKRRKAG